MNKNFLSLYVIVVFLVTILISITSAVTFFVYAYKYREVTVKHNISAHFTFSGHTYEDTLSDKLFQTALGQSANTLSPEALTQQRLETQTLILKSAKDDAIKGMTYATIYLLASAIILSAHQRLFRLLTKKNAAKDSQVSKN